VTPKDKTSFSSRQKPLQESNPPAESILESESGRRYPGLFMIDSRAHVRADRGEIEATRAIDIKHTLC
jgi:hypothetical protein